MTINKGYLMGRLWEAACAEQEDLLHGRLGFTNMRMARDAEAAVSSFLHPHTVALIRADAMTSAKEAYEERIDEEREEFARSTLDPNQ